MPLAEAGTAAWSLIDLVPGPSKQPAFPSSSKSCWAPCALDDRPVVERFLMGFTAEEVAQQLDCSERTVRRVRHLRQVPAPPNCRPR